MKRIVHQKVPVAVAQEIENYIKEAGLAPGAKLPSEREFMEILGVGRSSLREGLRILEVNGLIDVKSGIGMFVSFPAQTPKIRFLIDKKNLLDALKVRKQLELLAVEEAIENATEEDIQKIEASLLRLEACFEKGERDPEEDKLFHQLIYQATRNAVLVDILKNSDQLSRFWQGPFGDEAIFDSTSVFHRPIFESIRARDKQAGRNSVKKLMEQVAAEIEKKKNWPVEVISQPQLKEEAGG